MIKAVGGKESPDFLASIDVKIGGAIRRLIALRTSGPSVTPAVNNVKGDIVVIGAISRSKACDARAG